MVNRKLINRLNRRLTFSGAVLFAVIAAVFAASPAAATDVTIQIDQAAPIKLEQPAALVIVGNPSIADISAHDGSLFFVTGRNMGTTNLVAVDNQGNTIADVKIHVSTSNTHRVVLHRNVKRYTYSCADNCERVEMLGDVVTDKNPIPDFSDMDEANTRKLKIAEEGKKISEDAS